MDTGKLIQFAQSLVQCPSLSCEEEAVAQRVRAEMEALGYDQVTMDENGSVIGVIEGSGERTLLMDAHTDTVDVTGGVPWQRDPFSGTVFVFRNRKATAIKLLTFDGRGFWLCHRRLSRGRFRWWPEDSSAAARALESHELAVLLQAGDPAAAKGAPAWRRVSLPG